MKEIKGHKMHCGYKWGIYFEGKGLKTRFVLFQSARNDDWNENSYINQL